MALKDILPSQIGFGAAPLGNMFRDIPEEEATATVEAAWNDGIRYYETRPSMALAWPRSAWAQPLPTSHAMLLSSAPRSAVSS
jgi:hypothetical protein